jgi:flagellar protein FliJ
MATQFRLTTLLKLREATRDERRSELADAYRADDILCERLSQLRQEMAGLVEGCRRAILPGTVNIDLLIESQRYDVMLRAYEKQLLEQQRRLAAEIERRRLALVEADRDVRMLERLRERQAERERAEEQRREAKRLDEIAQRRAALRMAEANA